MAQTLATMIQPAQIEQFDLSTPMLKAAGLKEAAARGTLADMELSRAKQGQTLLSDYTSRKAGGDPRAIEALDARPDIQTQVIQARNALAESDRAAFDNRAMRIAKAAQEVSVVSDPQEKVATWNRKLDELKQDGLIDEARYRDLYGKPSDEVIKQAEAGGLAVKDFIALRQSERERAAGLDASRALSGVMGGRAASKTGPERGYFDTLKTKESGGRADARNPKSSATGLYQFTEETWNDLAQRHPELKLTDIKDPDQQNLAVRVLTAENINSLVSGDIAPTDKNLRVAHFLGGSGSKRFLDALGSTPGAKAKDFASPKAVAANRDVFFHKDGRARTVKGVYSELTKGMGAGASAMGALVPEGPSIGGLDATTAVPALTELASMPGIPKETRKVALELLKSALGRGEPTSDMKEYDLYRQQAVDAGETPLPFADYQKAQKKAGATNIQVAGGDIGLGKTAEGQVQKDLIASGEQLARLSSIRDTFKPEYQTLPFKAGAKMNQIKSWLGRDLTDGERDTLTDFAAYKRQALSNISLAIKELTGAAMSLPEAERIKGTQPNAGDGIFDGDDPVTFKAKLDDVMKSSMRAIARQHYVLSKGLSGKPWEVMGLDEVDDLINQRGNTLLEELKAQNPGANDADLAAEVKTRLRQEFGIGFEGAR